MNTLEADPLWLKVGDAAQLLGISVKGLYRLITEKRVPAGASRRVGSRVLVSVEWVRTGRVLEPGK